MEKYSTPRVEYLEEKKLIGHHMKMSLADNKTGVLWRQFAPRVKEIERSISEDKISMQVYPPSYYAQFSPTNEFEKWAVVEVENFEELPDGMKPFVLQAGLYAVFDYKGLSTDRSIFQYIFSIWLPQSQYMVDDRPHFEVLGPNYKNDDPNSEEAIWIPIREK